MGQSGVSLGSVWGQSIWSGLWAQSVWLTQFGLSRAGQGWFGFVVFRVVPLFGFLLSKLGAFGVPLGWQLSLGVPCPVRARS